MDWMQMLATALRAVGAGSPSAAKDTLGQEGAAGRVNANARDEYIKYVEQATISGEDPLPFARWIMQRNPATSQGPAYKVGD